MPLYTDVLTKVGLSKEAAEIYESLLSHGPQKASELAKATAVKRTYVYAVATELKKKGLVVEIKSGKKTVFRAQSPTQLAAAAEAEKQKSELALKELETALPGLVSLFLMNENKPIVRTFEGEEGIMKANLEVLAEKKDILAYLVINTTIDKKLEKFWDTYYKLRIERNIRVRSITSDTEAGIEYKKRDAAELRETRLVPKETFPLRIEKNIVGNKVAFFSSNDGKLIATIIENKEIADTERAIFELAWEEAGKLDKKKTS